MSTSHSSTALSAPATISAGARSPPIASIAIRGDKEAPFALLDVEDLAASVPTAVAAHGVREPGRAAIGAQGVCRRLDSHVRRFARTSRRATHLALRDGHDGAPRDLEVERPQGRPPGVEFFGAAVARRVVAVGPALGTQPGAVLAAERRG